MSGEADKAFWVKCPACSHCWPGAYFPLDATTFAKIAKRAVCPKCGNTKPVVAKQDNGTLNEPPALIASHQDREKA